MARYFVFLHILEPDISELLNIAIYTLNPLEKWGAHVTLAGPYESAKNLPRSREFCQKIAVGGVGQFRGGGQNTVFLKIGSDELRSVWDKPDYPYNPHLTIYDGSDRDLADNLYAKLNEVRPILAFHVSRLDVVDSPKGELRLPLKPPLQFKKRFGLPVNDIGEAWHLPIEEKIELAVLAIKRAKDYNISRFNRLLNGDFSGEDRVRKAHI